jgi:hypothetical protein
VSRLSLLVILLLIFSWTLAFAQQRGIELQAGGGYVFDSAEGPSVPAVNAGAVGWLTPGWGIGVRLAEGITDSDDHLRIWALTSQWRWFARGTEVNLGLGIGSSGWRVAGRRSGVGFLAIDLLAGRHLIGPFHVKGGFNWGVMDDSHPFQPVVLLAWKP